MGLIVCHGDVGVIVWKVMKNNEVGWKNDSGFMIFYEPGYLQHGEERRVCIVLHSEMDFHFRHQCDMVMIGQCRLM